VKRILQEIVDEIGNIPPVSRNTVRILRMVASNDYNVREMAELIGTDVSLSTRCLRVVNSAAFGLRKPVSTIERAVVLLGSKELLGMAVHTGFGDVYSAPLEGYSGESGVLWEHSLRTAVASRITAEAAGWGDTADIAYTAGLLHDMGKIIIAHYLAGQPDDFLEKYGVGEETDFVSVESRMLETDHAEVGYMMAERWGFPDPLKAAIRYHHVPGEAPEKFRKLCVLVHVGDILAMLEGFGTGCDTLAYRMDPEVERHLNLKPYDLERILIEVDSEFERITKTTLSATEK